MVTPPSPTFPSVYHPTISEYYPLALRLKDYLKCLIDRQDWSAVIADLPHSSQDDSVDRQYEELLSGVLLSFGDPQAVTIKESWHSGGKRRVGQQVQSQVDVSVSLHSDKIGTEYRMGSSLAMS
jgi:hypothetical protein